MTDSRGQAYYYKVSGVVDNQFCLTVSDSKPAVCQKDANAVLREGDADTQMAAFSISALVALALVFLILPTLMALMPPFIVPILSSTIRFTAIP